MQRVLVTGATGFLGGAVARLLKSRGVEVVGTGRNPALGAALESEGIVFHACDLSANPGAVQSLLDGCDAVVHAAALTSPWGLRRDFEAANVTATQYVAKACLHAGVRRLVHISSPSVSFDFKDQPMIKEDAPWAEPPANLYIQTKRAAEQVVLRAVEEGLDALMLRPKALFGPGDTALLPRIVRVARRGFFPLFGNKDPLMDLTAIHDAAEAVRLALLAPSACCGRAYHITSGDPRPRGAVLEALLSSCGLQVKYRPIPLTRALAAASLMEFVSRWLTQSRWEPLATRYSVGVLAFPQTLDICAARADLGYAPHTDVLAALRDCGLQWRAAHHPSNPHPS